MSKAKSFINQRITAVMVRGGPWRPSVSPAYHMVELHPSHCHRHAACCVATHIPGSISLHFTGNLSSIQLIISDTTNPLPVNMLVPDPLLASSFTGTNDVAEGPSPAPTVIIDWGSVSPL